MSIAEEGFYLAKLSLLKEVMEPHEYLRRLHKSARKIGAAKSRTKSSYRINSTINYNYTS